MRRHSTPRTAADRSTTLGYRPDLPQSAELIHIFASDEEYDPAPHDTLRCLGRQLARHHVRQWAAEDSARDREMGDHGLAAAKRTIDAMNAARVDLVHRIDVWVEAHLPEVPQAPLHTETLGSVIDRLAVAWVRTRQLGELARTSTDPELRERARRALEQLAELGDAYDDLLRELRGGRRRVPSWRPLKHYGGHGQ